MKVARLLAWAAGVTGVAVLLAVIITVTIGYTAYKPVKPDWIGVADKTLWDWINLLIIPFVIAVIGTVGGYFFTRSENRAAQAIAEKRAQDEALQAYLDQMGQLLLAKDRPLRQPQDPISEARTLARARTLTLLQRLDREHKRSVVQFLSEAFLIEAAPGQAWGESYAWTKDPPIIRLHDADLDYADLSGLQLGIVDLRGAHLRHADLTDVRLGLKKAMVTVQASTLEGADLSFATLRRAYLEEAHMKGVILRDADLTSTMFGAVDLTGADLTGAKGVTNEALEQQAKSLEGATMPDGQKYEDWVKSRGGGDDEENSSPS